MTISQGSAQSNGLGTLITALTSGTAQLIHTATGGSPADVVQVFAVNSDTIAHSLTPVLVNGGTTVVLDPVVVPVGNDSNIPVARLVLNGASTLSFFADTASLIRVFANVDNQASPALISGGALGSGLVAAVQNANRFAIFVNGGTGTATEANANIIMPRAGTLRNLVSKADVAIGGGATVTVAVRKNGVDSTLTQTLNNASGTTVQVNSAGVAVAQGDLVTFRVGCDNAGAPAANIQASVEFI